MTKVLHIVFDVYPAAESREFEAITGGYASCFVYERGLQLVSGRRKVLSLLDQEGWISAGTDQWGWLDSEDDLGDDELLRSRYRQVLIDGIVIQLLTRRRELIGKHSGVNLTSSYRRYVERHRGTQSIGLYSFKSRRWAMSRTPDGDDYMPLWGADSDAAKWRRRWPTHRHPWFTPQPLPNVWYKQLQTDDAWVGLGLEPDLLVTWHSLQLMADLGLKAVEPGTSGPRRPRGRTRRSPASPRRV